MFGEKRGGAPSCSPLTLPLASPATLTLQQQRTFPSAGQRKYLRESRPAVGGPTDSSLTSLGWLQNLKVPDLFSPEVRVMLHPPSPCSEDGCSSWETVSSSSTYSPPAGNNDPLLCAGGNAPRSPSPLRQCLLHSTEFRSAPKRYRSDSTKPHFPHTSLVYLALQHSRSGKASFYEICRWIKTNFKFFKESEPGWQVNGQHTPCNLVAKYPAVSMHFPITIIHSRTREVILPCFSVAGLHQRESAAK